MGKVLVLLALVALFGCRAEQVPVSDATASASLTGTTAASAAADASSSASAAASAATADATSTASVAASAATADATSAASGAQTAKPRITFNPWNLALGPLFIGAWSLFGLGVGLRVYRFVRLTRAVPRPRLYVAPRIRIGTDRPPVLAFGFRHWLRRTVFGTNPVMGVVSLVFHILLFLVPLLLPAHAGLIRQSTGAILPTLPADLLDRLTLVLMALGGFFLLRRILIPRVRALTTIRDYVILLLVVAPFASAYMAHHRLLDYHSVVLVHMLIGDLVIAAVPWTKLGHMPFLVLARFFIAGERAWKPGNRRWVDRRAFG